MDAATEIVTCFELYLGGWDSNTEPPSLEVNAHKHSSTKPILSKENYNLPSFDLYFGHLPHKDLIYVDFLREEIHGFTRMDFDGSSWLSLHVPRSTSGSSSSVLACKFFLT